MPGTYVYRFNTFPLSLPTGTYLSYLVSYSYVREKKVTVGGFGERATTTKNRKVVLPPSIKTPSPCHLWLNSREPRAD